MKYAELDATQRDLYLTMENDRETVRFYDANSKNLAKKAFNGSYKHEGAEKAFKNVADFGAKLYTKEYTGQPYGASSFGMFTVADRLAVVKVLAAEWRDEFLLQADDNARASHRWAAHGCSCHVVCLNCGTVTDNKAKAKREASECVTVEAVLFAGSETVAA